MARNLEHHAPGAILKLTQLREALRKSLQMPPRPCFTRILADGTTVEVLALSDWPGAREWPSTHTDWLEKSAIVMAHAIWLRALAKFEDVNRSDPVNPLSGVRLERDVTYETGWVVRPEGDDAQLEERMLWQLKANIRDQGERYANLTLLDISNHWSGHRVRGLELTLMAR